ncbi:MAG: peptide chain release factor 3 [Lachnospiraceae bacterium]|nr:peptide chain release factor 3 [Lachnospiraceae bacterium]MBQ5534500.1 peptide chain release factor 3 [Lachnospiraceae bacterium]MBQ9567272.1 peptide chain release factor 3 [Lachnospiraceae bacterium]
MDKDIASNINRRRTFAIISHPDAGKTTLTEKFLLYGGQLNTAGSVKGKATAKHAVSDWMDIEKERGISVTSSVLQFEYQDKCVNILDTPGHQDFSEDTYRTLMAADNAVMVIDAAKGVEPQTRKLFKVVARRGIPVFTFFNKMDRDALDSFELIDQVEHELGIETTAVTWPIGSGKDFKGVYDRNRKQVILFSDTQKGTKEGKEEVIDIDDEAKLREAIGEERYEQLMGEIDLLDGASAEYDQDAVSHGKLSPIFFGSALTNFGVESFLQYFLKMTTSPLPRMSDQGMIDPAERPFSAFVFKIQANMNKAHRDRVAFMRICSGKFTAGMDVWHVQGGKEVRLSQPQQMMADDRHMVNEAYAGDIIGIFDPGIYSIGDTLCMSSDKFRFGGIPTFAPEHFARVRQIDTMKRKQFVKGITQIAQEGAIQIFEEPKGGMEEIIVGVVGVLQFDVLEYRLKNEYNVDIRMEQLPYEYIRWIKNDNIDLDAITGTSDMKKIRDLKGNPLLLFVNSWSVGMTLDRNEGLILEEFNENE